MRGFVGMVCAVVVSLVWAAGVRAAGIQVSAAISLKEAVLEIAKQYKAGGGDDVEFTFGSSGQLAQQIEDGADVDAFISAANKQVDELVAAKMADAATRRAVAGNTLVLVVPGKGGGDGPRGFADLADGKYKRIAIGEPRTVPAGQYAMETLKALKIDDKLADRLVLGTNVRAVLAYVESGDVAAGLVYATDAKEVGDKVKVVATAEEKWHEPIVYPAVVMAGSRKKAAAVKFLDYFKSAEARKVLGEKGFSVGAAADFATTAPG